MPKYEYVVYRYCYKIHDYKIESAFCNKRFSKEKIKGIENYDFAVFHNKRLHIDAEGKLYHKEAYDQENTYALIYGNKLIFSAYCSDEKLKNSMNVAFERNPLFVSEYIKAVMDLYNTTKEATL